MPKQTFFNLPKDKKETIIEAAFAEFENSEFESSSVNRIIEKSKISKGSFYQYFENKKDLYKYVISLIISEKMNYISDLLKNPVEHDFFTLIGDMYVSALTFAKKNPRMVNIGNKLLKFNDNAIYKEIVGENMGKSEEIFKSLLVKAIDNGEIRSDINIEQTAFMISSINFSIVEYYREKYSREDYGDDLIGLVNEFLDIIKVGIIKKEE